MGYNLKLRRRAATRVGQRREGVDGVIPGEVEGGEVRRGEAEGEEERRDVGAERWVGGKGRPN